MNLQPVAPAAIPVLLRCVRCCGRYYVGRSAHKMWADLDGTPWVDYYCDQCSMAVAPLGGVLTQITRVIQARGRA